MLWVFCCDEPAQAGDSFCRRLCLVLGGIVLPSHGAFPLAQLAPGSAALLVLHLSPLPGLHFFSGHSRATLSPATSFFQLAPVQGVWKLFYL